MKDEAKRHLNNICQMVSYRAVVSSELVDYFLDTYSDLQMCQGKLRRIIFTPLGNKHYEMRSEVA